MASSIDNNGNFNVSSASIQLRANSGGVPLSHDDVDSNFENLRLGHNAVVTALGQKASISHVHDLATAGASGFMSSTMFSKLDGIAENANNYSLEAANGTDLGGVKIGDNININSGKISVPLATTATPGVVEYDNSTIKKNSSGQLYVNAGSVNTNTTYDDGVGLDLVGTTFSHSDTSSQANISLSSRTYINGLTFDAFGHVTGYTSATETVVNTDTNTTYSADGVGITLSGTQFKHADTSSANSVNNSGNTVIQDVTIDEFGHVTNLVSKTVANATEVTNQGSTVAKGLEFSNTARGDAGEIALHNATFDYPHGKLYSTNDTRPLKVYINAVSGESMSNTYGTNDGNGIFWTENGPIWRGVIDAPDDTRYRAIPKKFINYGQAEAYVNKFHPYQTQVQYFFETDVTETLYPDSAYSENNTIMRIGDEQRIEFHGFKSAPGDEATGPYSGARVVKWEVNYGGGRVRVLDTTAEVVVRNMQFKMNDPQDWIMRVRGGRGKGLWLEGYVGYIINGNFRYAAMTVESGAALYDLSYGDIYQTNIGSYGNGSLYHYEASSNSTINQFGQGSAVYIYDGKVGCAKLHGGSQILFNSHGKPHSGGADPQVPQGFANPLPSVYWDYTNHNTTGANKEEIYLQYGPYVRNNRSTATPPSGYDPLGDLDVVPSIFLGGYGNSWDWMYKPGDHNNLHGEPIAKNAYKYSQMPGNKTWANGSIAGIERAANSSTLQWSLEDYGFDATMAATVNHPLFGSRPIHPDQVAMSTPHKFRSLAVYNTGRTHGSPVGTGEVWGNYYTSDFHANNIANVPDIS